jgi:hypothetical protein
MEIPLLVPQTAFITIEGIIDIPRLQQRLGTLVPEPEEPH